MCVVNESHMLGMNFKPHPNIGESGANEYEKQLTSANLMISCADRRRGCGVVDNFIVEFLVQHDGGFTRSTNFCLRHSFVPC